MSEIVVSAIMPTFNAAQYLRSAIDSVIGQTFHDWELIVIDDGSTDSTSTILSSYSDSRVKVFTLPDNKGRGFARNACLREAQGRYIAICDSDDISLSHRFATQVQFLNARPDIGVVASQLLSFDTHHSPMMKFRYPESEAAIAAQFRRGRMAVPNPSAMIRSRLFTHHGLYAEECLYAQDLEFFLRASTQEQFCVLAEPLILYRQEFKGLSLKQWIHYERYREYAVARARASSINETPPSFKAFMQAQRLGVAQAVLIAGRYGLDWLRRRGAG